MTGHTPTSPSSVGTADVTHHVIARPTTGPTEEAPSA